MPTFWVGVVAGALITGMVGGPLATRLSVRSEARGDRGADRDAQAQEMAAQLAADEAGFTAYDRQYRSWAILVGGAAVALALAGGLAALALLAADAPGAAGVVAGLTAVIVGACAVFWVRKLIALRRVTRLVYRERRG